MNESPRWIGVGRTEIGYMRSSNQDAFASLNERGFWIVADGMGGHPGGDLAAQIAVEVSTQKAETYPNIPGRVHADPGQLLTECITAANQAIHEKAREDPSLKGMGTTVVAMAIVATPRPVAYIAHLGDSRAYHYDQTSLTQVTQDHTLLSMLLERGLIDKATALAYPDRHVLAKGLGLSVNMIPDVTSISLNDKDLLLLCSDGLTKMLEDHDIASILFRAGGDPHRACHELIEEALHRGGEDNVTVIVCAHATGKTPMSLGIDKTPPAM